LERRQQRLHGVSGIAAAFCEVEREQGGIRSFRGWPVFQHPTDARRQLREREIPPLDRPHLEPIGQFGPLRVCFLEHL